MTTTDPGTAAARAAGPQNDDLDRTESAAAGPAGPSPTPTATPVVVNVYVDVVCPWCYIGKRNLDQAVAAFTADGSSQVAVRYMPFQLDPDAPAEASELMPTLARKFGGEEKAVETTTHITQIAAAGGIELDFDAALAANTMSAHRLLLLAAQEDLAVQHELLERLFAAHFTQGLDINDSAVLQQLATDSGLDVDVPAFLATDEGIEVVNEQQAAARAAGITSVPTYVFANRWGVGGAQEVSTLLMILRQVQTQADAQPGGGGCGGGCGCGGENAAQAQAGGCGGGGCGGGGCACG